MDSMQELISHSTLVLLVLVGASYVLVLLGIVVEVVTGRRPSMDWSLLFIRKTLHHLGLLIVGYFAIHTGELILSSSHAGSVMDTPTGFALAWLGMMGGLVILFGGIVVLDLVNIKIH